MTAKYITLEGLLKKSLGVTTYERISAAGVTIGTTAARVVRNSPNRVAFVFINLSVNSIYIAPIITPSATRGIRVGPSGGLLRVVWDEDFSLTGYEWNAVASAAASEYFLIELLTAPEEEEA